VSSESASHSRGNVVVAWHGGTRSFSLDRYSRISTLRVAVEQFARFAVEGGGRYGRAGRLGDRFRHVLCFFEQTC